MSAAEIIVLVFVAYVLVGIVFAVYFALSGVGRIDEAAKNSGFGFRLIIIPASAALWPLLLYRIAAGKERPVEGNAHRSAALKENQ